MLNASALRSVEFGENLVYASSLNSLFKKDEKVSLSIDDKKRYFAQTRLKNYQASLTLEGFSVPDDSLNITNTHDKKAILAKYRRLNDGKSA
jgi:hypothetical protein